MISLVVNEFKNLFTGCFETPKHNDIEYKVERGIKLANIVFTESNVRSDIEEYERLAREAMKRHGFGFPSKIISKRGKQQSFPQRVFSGPGNFPLPFGATAAPSVFGAPFPTQFVATAVPSAPCTQGVAPSPFPVPFPGSPRKRTWGSPQRT